MARFPIILALVCAISGAFAATVPVVMWGPGSKLTSALNGNPESDLIDAVVDSSLTLAFAEDRLTAEDISQCKDESRKSCFNYLSGLSSKSYVQVSQPIERIEETLGEVRYVYVDKDGQLDSEIPLKESKVVIVSLALDPELSREENLVKHDGYIKKIYNNVISAAGDANVVALYTGKSSGSLVRKARQVSSTAAPASSSTAAPVSTSTTASSGSVPMESSNGTILQAPEILMYFTNLTFTDKDTKVLTVKSLSVSKTSDESRFTVTMVTQDDTIKFNVTNGADGYWSVTDVEYGKYDNFVTDRTVGAADGFSYYCGPPTKYTLQAGQALTWTKWQIQPNFSTNPQINKFNDPYNCVGFTSIPIWSGLLVTVILLAIMSIGVTWLMDIRTMDRFDDPKGKTITVNTAE
ncbi:unnamed protein product [Hermetia illucens]|uniref:V-type proton ATPase subunit S1 n=1 Tax=Hermetia illucens TaxID=343691 RepID=A0A7R8UA72_HERIL|nr:V-type proton ATPase subunit S1 [Hermetia illucens]CAD7077033.1 unnamed protein product [Hermetia illucens]